MAAIAGIATCLSNTETTSLIKSDVRKQHVNNHIKENSSTMSGTMSLLLPRHNSTDSVLSQSVCGSDSGHSRASTPEVSPRASPRISPRGSPSPQGSPTGQRSRPVFRRQISTGAKYVLLNRGEIQVCRLNHTRTIISKIMNSRYLRRWENHHLILGDTEVTSSTPSGFMEKAVPYSNIEDINIISRWDAGQNFCLRITIPDGSVLLQAPNYYLRDQWLYSMLWKRHMLKYRRLLKNTRRPEILVREIKNMIDMSLSTPIQDESVYQFPLDIVSQVLQQNTDYLTRVEHENIIKALGPLLENKNPSHVICDFFIKHCKNSPRSHIVIELFTPVVHRILKYNTDFGKFPQLRTFVQEYVHALSLQNDGRKTVKAFVQRMHGVSSTCPHPRVLPNLVAVCLAAVYNYYEYRRNWDQNSYRSSTEGEDNRLLCFIDMMETMSEFDDWRPSLSSLLQPIPFPDDALSEDIFTGNARRALVHFATDARCDVHQSVLGIREGKEGWFHLYCPGGIACDDDGELFALMLKMLMQCCCRRKTFIMNSVKMVSPCMLLALRENEAAMEFLCAVLEFEVIDDNDVKMQIITTLQSTSVGKRKYAITCEKQIALKELQQKGGPKKLTLPPKSTDADLSKLLSSGSFGNMECLSLAFTQVTSECAKELIKLPSLRYLNLWSTQFGDQGLQLLSEHLPKLEVLNLCETPVTDKGLQCLSTMKTLWKLNLNSTNLSPLTFEILKESLPKLAQVDVRYTDVVW